MKKLILYSFMSLFLISSCRKSDNANVPEFTKVPMPTVKKVSGDATISAIEPSSFAAKFSVGLYFPDAEKPAKMDVIVRKNLDNTKTKVFKADVTTYPTEFSVSGADLLALFPGDIVLGDKFDFGVDLTLANGTKYLAFPTVGVPYGAGVAGPAGSSTSTRFEAVCQFVADDYTGAFSVEQDDWADFTVGQTVMFTKVSADKISFPSPVTGNPIVISVSAANVPEIASQEWGDYGAGWSYGMVKALTTASADNVVAPCDGTISLNMRYQVTAGSWSNMILIFKKK